MSDTDRHPRTQREPACAPVLLCSDDARRGADGPDLAQRDPGFSIAVTRTDLAAAITAS